MALFTAWELFCNVDRVVNEELVLDGVVPEHK